MKTASNVHIYLIHNLVLAYYPTFQTNSVATQFFILSMTINLRAFAVHRINVDAFIETVKWEVRVRTCD